MEQKGTQIIFAKLILGLVALILTFGFLIEKNYADDNVIKFDTANYYYYLPAAFIYHDFYMHDADKLKKEHLFFLNTLPNGTAVSKMTMGWAMINLPAFLLADTYAQMFDYERNGLSLPYIAMIMLNLLLFLFLGMFYLHKFLCAYFNPVISATAVGLIVLGSNIPYYTLYEPMSHVYGFTLFSIILHLTNRYSVKATLKIALLLGFCAALLCLVRPTNLLLLLFPLAVFITHSIKLKQTPNAWHALAFLACGILVCVPQVLYWHHMTGLWIVYSYTGEAFHFDNPEVLNGLFSFRKGWIMYSPIVAFGLAGIIWAAIKKQVWGYFSIVTLIIFLFVIFSWWCWWYGGGLGSRATIEILPLVAMGLAYFIQVVFRKTSLYLSIPFTCVLLFATCIGMFFIWQYQVGLLHWDGMSKEAYEAVFLKAQFPENHADLIDPPDYAKAYNNTD